MNLYLLAPEVAGGHGEQTVYGTEKEIKEEGISGKVQFLHYEFYGWLGDDLLESTPCFIVSDKFKNALESSQLRDFKIEKCLISLSEEFQELYPDKKIPDFWRLTPIGTVTTENAHYTDWSGHHFCLSSRGDLVLTEEVLLFLKSFALNHCDITLLKRA
ncbi:hypothetical protein P4T54_11485 [Bacillus mycoides]|uniref:hypothetical protein n=1 Tax=Bacillus mycoides TaxID=1405 RepID=UPI00285332DF|nr:hypothetical protein [Bacillus mycoides]MDR4904621.1 hypothetical protein [Bacillus mycoides]MED1013960.1 hypothetical protein [Bacillus mycoides]MED1045102.1 hypothetical protein [Bacillus mycoides]MED1054882.1 hypothetical protein [Bacillus mycoides]